MDKNDYSKRELIGVIETHSGKLKIYRPLVQDMWLLDLSDPLAMWKLAANCIDGVSFEDIGEWPIEDAEKLSDLLSDAMKNLGSYK